MKRFFWSVLLAAMIVLSSSAALAGSTSANLTVSVTVDSSCSISTGALTFPEYNSLGTHSSSYDDGTGSIIISCSIGTTANIGLSGGNNYTDGSNHMNNGMSNLLPYVLYQDASHSTLWTNTYPNKLTTPPAPNINPQTYTVFGRIPPGQSIPGGNYSDTVVATVNF